MDVQNNVEYVDAIYQTEGQVGAVPYVSVAFGSDKRRMKLGNFANGDAVRVTVHDVIAAPSRFLAPCGKPYTVNGNTLVNPCGDEVRDVEDPAQTEANFTAPVSVNEARESLVEMFGTQTAADRLIEAGYITGESLADLDDEVLEGIVGSKRAVGNYRKYVTKQGEQAAAAEEADAAKTDA